VGIRAAAAVGGACLLFDVGTGGAAFAQAPGVPAIAPIPGEPTTQVYDQAFFAQYQLSNAEDMLRRLPGVTAILDGTGVSQARGLGAGTEQVLIDGKRMAGKSTSVTTTLRRIPAASVARVELLRGTTEEVQSDGLVVNVVLKAGVNLGAVGNYELAYRYSDKGWSDVDGLVSYAGTRGRLSYVLGYERTVWSPLGLVPADGANDFSVRTRDERYFYPSGGLMEARTQKSKRTYVRHSFTASSTYDLGGGDNVRLNLLYQPNPAKLFDIVAVSRFGPTGAATTRATEVHYNKIDTTNLELGGEIKKTLGRGNLSVIALHSRTGIGTLDFRNSTASTGVLTELARNVNDQHLGEDVVRASYVWPITRRQTLKLGGEGARNSLTQDIQVFFDTNRDGRLDKIDVPTSFARVQEARGELFVNDSWKFSPKLTVDTALYFELSRLTTNYPAIPIRTLHYLKPRLDVRWTPTPVDRFRFTVARTVGQLDFTAFVPSYNVVDLRIDLGNPLIRPFQILLIEAAYERRLAHDNGTLSARLFDRRVRDVPSFIPLAVPGSPLPQSQRGNIPQSDVWGGELDASVRLAALGYRSAQVNLRVVRNLSSVIDQFSGRPRLSASAYPVEFSLGFRYDIARLRASYGFDYLDTEGTLITTNVRNLEYLARGQRLGAFVEKAIGRNYSLRLEAYNLNGVVEDKQRLLYAVSQADGAIGHTETYRERRDRRFALKFRGKF
jgi:outer membrane receptor for ferrienterochelin and colicins